MSGIESKTLSGFNNNEREIIFPSTACIQSGSNVLEQRCDPQPPHNFRKEEGETAKSLDRAFEFAAGLVDGVVFSSDWGRGKQFHVLDGGLRSVYN